MILTICMVMLAVLPSGSTDEWTKNFAVERAARIHVETSDANLRVIAWDGANVQARITTKGWKIGGDGIAIVDHQTGDQMPVTVSGRTGNRHVRGQINGGGKLLSLRTGDGSIHLEKH